MKMVINTGLQPLVAFTNQNTSGSVTQLFYDGIILLRVRDLRYIVTRDNGCGR